MPDSRFFHTHPPVTLAEVAKISGAELVDPARSGDQIVGVAPLGRATGDHLTYLSDKRYAAELATTRAKAVILYPGSTGSAPEGIAVLISREPQAAYARVAAALHPEILHPGGGSLIDPTAVLEEGVRLSPGVVIGPGAKVGSGTTIGANAVIGPGVAIGRDCRIGSTVSIGFALIGDRVMILPNAAIGQAGFGVAASSGGALDLPQLGRVIIQDEVTIGACTCIDRGAFDDTVIGQFTKIDNLVQIAHNVVIGQNCALAAQTGLSGSVTVGDGVQFGGKAGVGDHLVLHDGSRLAAGALAMRDVPAGETWCGVPARPIRRFMRELAWVSHAMDREKSRGRGGGDADG